MLSDSKQSSNAVCRVTPTLLCCHSLLFHYSNSVVTICRPSPISKRNCAQVGWACVKILLQGFGVDSLCEEPWPQADTYATPLGCKADEMLTRQLLGKIHRASQINPSTLLWKSDGELLTELKVSAGMPQGSCLSPQALTLWRWIGIQEVNGAPKTKNTRDNKAHSCSIRALGSCTAKTPEAPRSRWC